MHWQIFIALLIAIPVILLPAAVLWYVDAGEALKTFWGKIRKA